MRMLLRLTIPVEAGNRTILDGTLPQVMESMMNRLKPEAAYFIADHGQRTALIFFDMTNPTEIPGIAEPFFMKLNAAVEFIPAMNAEDLQAGLAEAAKAF